MNGFKVDDLKLTLTKQNKFLLQQIIVCIEMWTSWNLGVVFDSQFILIEQIYIVKRKVIVSLIKFSCISIFIDKDSKIKLVHGLVFSIIELCNSLY